MSAANLGFLFCVTDEDIAALSDIEFEEVWSALGTVARARSRKQVAPAVGETQVSAEAED